MTQVLELGNSDRDFLLRQDVRMLAAGRQRSSQMPCCNGADRVKDCQGKLSKMAINRCSEESR